MFEISAFETIAALAATPMTSAPLPRLSSLIRCPHMAWSHPFDASSSFCPDNAAERALPHGPLVLLLRSEGHRRHERGRVDHRGAGARGVVRAGRTDPKGVERDRRSGGERAGDPVHAVRDLHAALRRR